MKILPVEAELFHADGQTWWSFSQFYERAYKILLQRVNPSLGASSPLCYKQLGRGWGTSKHNCLVSYLLCWHVSATVRHLQVTKMYTEENYTEYDNGIGAYSKLSTRSRCRLG